MSADAPDEFVVNDDSDARAETRDWAYGEIAGGREPEAVEAELVAGRWPADDAAAIVEQARQQSRHRRGAYTRADVARDADARYGGNMAANPLLASGSTRPRMFPLVGSLINAIASLFRAGKPPDRRPPSMRR